MFLKRYLRLPNTLVFWLTLWYSGIFTVSFLLAFVFFHIFLTSVLHKLTDKTLTNEAKSILKVAVGLDRSRTDMVLKVLSGGSGKVFLRIINPDEEKFASQNLLSGDIGVNQTLLGQLNSNTGHVFETVSIPQTQHKIRVIYLMIGPRRILQIGQSMEEADELLRIFRNVFTVTMILLTPFAALIGWFMAKRALKGVEEATRTAIHIYNGEYDSRIPITGRGEEVDRLATTFNNMLERIQSLIRGMREMSENIAHDLRSPITRIRVIAETAMTTDKCQSHDNLMAGNIIEECDRLLGITNMMLDISEAEGGISKLNKSELDASELVEKACEVFQMIADEKGIKIIADFRGNTTIYADEQKMQRVVSNLLDNAVKYSTTGSAIIVSVSEDKNGVNISIKDNGIGISPEDLPNIFKRFYRCDTTRSTPGVGLGLSWAQALVHAHGGKILVTSALNEGSTFIITIPQNHSERLN